MYSFKFKPFSEKQIKILSWWTDNSPVKLKDGIIADGAIRSGKTMSMSLSYIMWAMERFEDETFGMCGKTIGSFRRNVFKPLRRMLKSRGYAVDNHRSDNYFTVTLNGISNDFYIFGGKDESSQDLIQGITLAGCFFDEVALMPESFVNQATGRCSVEGSTFWFNCNPDSPEHWFYKNWIKKHKELNLLYLHFTMDDNLSLSEKIKERYRKMYSGVFFDRFIRGLWVIAAGLVYSNFNKDLHVVKTVSRPYTEYKISIDYGTYNPFSMGLWGLYSGVWYRVKEYWYCGRDKGVQKDDSQYYDDLCEFAGDLPITCVIVDPSASSFITHARHRGKYAIITARNDVMAGIRSVQLAYNNGKIKINDCCTNLIRENGLYSYDDKATEDTVVKEDDHACDDCRYFVFTTRIAIPTK